MTEAEWLASTDPAAMLRFLTRRNAALVGHDTMPPAGFVTDRKLRLFACACCRQVWDGQKCQACQGVGAKWEIYGPDDNYDMVDCLACHGTGRVGGLTDPRSRRAVEVAERYADGEATKGERVVQSATMESLQRRRWEELRIDDRDDARTHLDMQWSLLCWASCAVSGDVMDGGQVGTGLQGNSPILNTAVPPITQAALLRDIFSNPFRRHNLCGLAYCDPAVPPDVRACQKCRSILRWNDGMVPRIARGIYDERRWQDMPILHDALFDAGCDDEEILRHCRGYESIPDNIQPPAEMLLRGPHVRGCWVLDLILGKQ